MSGSGNHDGGEGQVHSETLEQWKALPGADVARDRALLTAACSILLVAVQCVHQSVLLYTQGNATTTK